MDVDEDEVYLVCSCMQQKKVKRRHFGYYECIFPLTSIHASG
jgi:hypothetical protein